MYISANTSDMCCFYILTRIKITVWTCSKANLELFALFLAVLYGEKFQLPFPHRGYEVLSELFQGHIIRLSNSVLLCFGESVSLYSGILESSLRLQAHSKYSAI